ncbi:hypothetical protein HELRODRAFT_192675 [Helobdella robusta]|uniref:Uncharacterized protein n=1 Tax=Helobdella robusta TaxID=6412 RepID=T1FU64_HELRO|nr:hypothetical protein HELRODRAFT_192675 [Helobdella robusta]ESN99972.1 hypothetical protein HELRODRAFT_192675 [Helobdella robusta]
MILTGTALTSSIIVCVVLTAICHLIALVSPYWLVSSLATSSSDSQEKPDFSNLGLWTICFEKFVHPYELPPKEYFECHSLASEELSNIVQWLVPNWLFVCRKLAITSTVTMTLSTVMTVFLLLWSSYQRLDKFSQRRLELLTTVAQYVTPVCLIVSSILLLLTVSIFSDNAKRHQHHEFWLLGSDDVESFDLHLSMSWVFELLAFVTSCLTSALVVWFLILKSRDEI